MRAALLCCQWETDRSRGGDDFWCSGRTTTVRYMSVVSTENFCVRDAGADGSGRWIFVAVDVDIVDDFSLITFY